MNCISGIYKITSPIGKIYIGMSCDIDKRFSFYQKLNCKSQRLLYESFMKYGVSNHKFEVIEECDISDLSEKEKYYIKSYNSFNRENGLNMTIGGKHGRPPKSTNSIDEKCKLKQRYTVMITKKQAESLEILRSKGVNVSQFIRQAIKEKLQRDWKGIKEKHGRKIENAPAWLYD